MKKNINAMIKNRIWLTFLVCLVILVVYSSCEKDEIPSVSTMPVTDITVSEAKTGGNVTSNGSLSVTARGVVWSQTEGPAIDFNDGRTYDGEGIGEYASIITGLSPGSTYYVRAYAVNGEGVAYGQQNKFSTLFEFATVTTLPVSGISSSNAKSGGNVLSDGGSDVTARGIVWSRTPYPDLENNEGQSEDGIGNGEFVSELTDIEPNTKYYVRAYAVNGAGTSYGEQEIFNSGNDPVPGPLFVFGFDDGNDSDYYTAYQMLKQRGYRGTSFANTNMIGEPGRLKWEMIHEMVNDGWEMGCHTHSHIRLTDATDAQIREEMETVDALYIAQGLPTPKHITYPYGANDQRVRKIVSEYRLSGRRASSLTNNYGDPVFYILGYRWVHADMYALDTPNGLNNAKAEVDLAFEGKTVLVSFLIHQITESYPGGYVCVRKYFQELLDYIIEKGGTIVTQKKAYEIISDYRQSLNLE
jgi:peptidoglycan/xylan/chitin deacetylase (PgdA/CDA1 family)